MKKTILKISILLMLTIACALPCFSQTPDSRVVSKSETVAFLIRQNENAREVIKAQEARISELEAQTAIERENSDSVEKSYQSAKIEILSLKQANDALTRALKLNEQTIEILKSENGGLREKAKRATRDKWKVIGGVAAAIAIKVFL